MHDDPGAAPTGEDRTPAIRATEHMVTDLAIRLGALGFLIALAFSVLRPFLGLLLWSMILTVALYPAYTWLRARMGGRGIPAAAAITATLLAILFGPIALLITSMVISLEKLAFNLRANGNRLPPLPEAIADLSYEGTRLGDLWSRDNTAVAEYLRAHVHSFLGTGEWALHIIAELTGSVVVFAVSVVIAGLLFVPGHRFFEASRAVALRVTGLDGDRFVGLAVHTIRSVARGVIGIAVLESILIGAVFLGFAVPHAGLWTLMALVLAIVQIGTSVVVIPVVIWFWLSRDIGPAVLFTLALLPLVPMEHLLKPLAMGKGLETPVLLIFVGVLGGTVAFGLTGLFLGPLILALVYDLALIWLQKDRPPPPEPG